MRANGAVRGSGTAHLIGVTASETCTSTVSADSSSASVIDPAGNNRWLLGAASSGQGTRTNARTPRRLVERDSDAVSSATTWILRDADAEVYFPGRGGNTSVDAWKATLLYGALGGFSAWGLRGLLRSRSPQRSAAESSRGRWHGKPQVQQA